MKEIRDSRVSRIWRIVQYRRRGRLVIFSRIYNKYKIYNKFEKHGNMFIAILKVFGIIFRRNKANARIINRDGNAFIVICGLVSHVDFTIPDSVFHYKII